MSNKEVYEELKEAKEEGYEWLAKDGDGFTYAYRVEPYKCGDKWECEDALERIVENDVLSWHEEEPYKIDDLLEMYEVG